MFASAYVWAKVLDYIEEQLGAVTVSNWFDAVEVVDLTEEHLIIHTSSDFRRDVIAKRFSSSIQEALKTIFAIDATIVIFGDEELKKYRFKSNSPPRSQTSTAAPLLTRKVVVTVKQRRRKKGGNKQ